MGTGCILKESCWVEANDIQGLQNLLTNKDSKYSGQIGLRLVEYTLVYVYARYHRHGHCELML